MLEFSCHIHSCQEQLQQNLCPLVTPLCLAFPSVAFCLLEVMLGGGILDLRSKPIFCNHADSARFLCATLRKADSTFETILGIGILVGVIAKFRPLERTELTPSGLSRT